MLCPKCQANNNTVIDSRSKADHQKRIRRCHNCGQTFNTREYYDPDEKVTVKPMPAWAKKNLKSYGYHA